jgi:hypothetical protein
MPLQRTSPDSGRNRPPGRRLQDQLSCLRPAQTRIAAAVVEGSLRERGALAQRQP